MTDTKFPGGQSAQTLAAKTDACGFGRGHQDIDEDLAALHSVMGLSAISGSLRQLKATFSGLKSRFAH